MHTPIIQFPPHPFKKTLHLLPRPPHHPREEPHPNGRQSLPQRLHLENACFLEPLVFGPPANGDFEGTLSDVGEACELEVGRPLFGGMEVAGGLFAAGGEKVEEFGELGACGEGGVVGLGWVGEAVFDEYCC